MQALMEASNKLAGTAGEDRQHTLNLVYWISLVRGLRVNLDTMYVIKAKFQIKCSSMWTSIDVFKTQNKVSLADRSALQIRRTASRTFPNGKTRMA